MAVYDDENQTSNPLTPDELSEKEAKTEPTLDSRLSDIKDKISGTETPGTESAIDGSGESGGFFKNDKGGKSSKKPGGVLKNRKALLGLGGGLIGVVFAAGAMFNFLHTFQMDHFFKNVEAKTSSRLSASLDTRNKSLVRAYIQVRVTEIEGSTNGENLFFKGNQVKTDNPIRDWYHTMRTSKFEEEVLNKQGVYFTSMVGPDGKINIAKVTANDSVKQDLASKYLTNTKDASGKAIPPISADTLGDRLNAIPSDDMEKLFTVEKLDSHKSARKSVKEVVNKEVPWYRTFKRRHIRKDIANETGIKNWRLFEKTRDKVAKSKQDIKDQLFNKIIEKYFVNSPSSAQFLKCLFSDGRCSGTSDPASPDNKSETATLASSPDSVAPADSDPPSSDGAGGTKPSPPVDTAGAGKEARDGIEGAVKKGTTDVAENAAIKLGPFQKIILALVNTLAGDAITSGGPNPSKIWTWAKRLAKIDGLLSAVGGNSKIAKMVINARSSQLAGVYATYQIASDQMKSGQLVGDELNSFFDTTKNLGNSEGWATVTNQMNKGGAASAAAATSNNQTKEDYCKVSPANRSFDEFAWMCDDQKPNSGGRAQVITDQYNNSVGPLINPIAKTVEAVNNTPVGWAITWFNGAVDKITSVATEPLLKFVSESGIGKDIAKFIGSIMFKLLGFLGAGPMFEPGTPGVGNLLVAGAAVSAETSTRASGGVASTAKSLAYANKLASQYKTEQTSNQSFVERYASLDNPDSLASGSLFAISSNMDLSQLSSKFGNYIQSLPALFGSIFTGRVFAAQPQSASAVSDWAGVNKYDIPAQCINLDPLDSNYLEASSNVSDISLSPTTLGYDTMRDTDKFWKAVYDKLGDAGDAQSRAEKIYNCALFDARVEGSLGAVYGYTNDNGYNPNAGPAASAPASSGELGVSQDGFVFPLKTTKSTIINHKPAAWCFKNQANCHHDYNAADIFADTGTTVVSPTGGTVVSTYSASGGTGSHVILKSDKGFIFYFTHMKEGSIKVIKGQVITAGTELGNVGTDADAAGTASHLHFDALASPPAENRPSCAGAECAKYPFLEVQPALTAAFNTLPE